MRDFSEGDACRPPQRLAPLVLVVARTAAPKTSLTIFIRVPDSSRHQNTEFPRGKRILNQCTSLNQFWFR